jgi:dienelactone hydrolase
MRSPIRFRLLAVVLAVGALSPSASRASETLRVLMSGADGTAPGEQFERWLKGELYQLIDRRTAAVENLKSAAECRTWQEERRAFFLRQIGGLPERTPLNSRVVGVLQGKGYRIEKILFESRPGFHVTANLYLPDSPPPWPAVIVPVGHSHNGKAWGSYQRTCILLARHGMAALCYDPVGQGERYQMLDRTRTRTHFADSATTPVPHPNVQHLCTIEHTALGLSSALLGANVAQFRIWDGMRAIDYLQSRADIRADKIGCAGQSGGGTLTAYLMALDERILAAAPVGYLTTFRRVIDSASGPQDGEQNIFGQLGFGMDEADYVNMRAPRPTLIGGGTREVTFNIHGTWELFREAKRFYSRLGHAERVEIHEPDAPHSMSIDHREAIARWMHRWLLGSDKPIRELDPRPDPWTDQQDRALSVGDWTDAQLQCTPQGQVLLLPGERSAFEINAATAAGLQEKRAGAWARLSLAEKRRLIRETVQLSDGDALPTPTVETVGRVERDGFAIHKLVLTAESGLRLSALAYVPARATGAATLYLHGTSMPADPAPGGPIDALLRQGQIVVAAELRGLGETAPPAERSDWSRGHFGPGQREFFLAYLMGKSVVGMRTADVLRWAQFLRGFQAPITRESVHLVAQGAAAIPALHGAALAGEAFTTVTLKNMVRSWEDVVGTPEPARVADIVHGALRNYTLTDLVETVGAAKVSIVQPADVSGRVAAAVGGPN